MKILVIGKGKMGTTLKELYPNEVIEQLDTIEEIASFDKQVDGVIDFSHHSLIQAVLDLCLRKKIPLVIGTTGLTEEENIAIKNASKVIPLCVDSNYSLGILNLKKCIESLSHFTFEKIVITETHHEKKLDIPSGTSLSLKKYLNKMFINEIEIKSYRKGDITGIHKIDFINKNETISIKHEAYNRSIFACGAKMALEIFIKKAANLYSFEEIMNG